jgi:hypothetical protein
VLALSAALAMSNERASELADARSLRSFCGIWNDGCNSFRVVPEGRGTNRC